MIKKLVLLIVLTIACVVPTFAQDCLVKQLRAEARGLSYQSEADYPVTVFFMAARTKRAKQFAARTPDASHSFDDFAAQLTQAESWHGAAETKTRKQYERVFNLMKANLHDLKVVYFKVSRSAFQVYVVGKNYCGDFVGLRMREVETGG
ncbi:MAG TPA: nuclease A inhibitor family protein [Blastocatellia bacterium]|nr:nuclease A inhibitor family protein [Blastocatellia bacterium]